MTQISLDERIDNLQPGASFKISESNGIQVWVERTGCGKKLRFVRISDKGSNIFKTTNFIKSI